jgi:S-layer protein
MASSGFTFPPANNTDFITELYIGYYDRAPDPAGLSFWLTAMTNGASLTQVANAFASSSESLALYPFLSVPNLVNASTFVTQVYNNLLNRAPDSAGLTFWSQELQSGSVTPGGFILAVEQSVNMQVGTADALTLAAKGTVAENYVLSVAAANVQWSEASAHAALAPVSGIGNSPATPAEVAAGEAVTSAFIAGNGLQNTTALTTGVDTLNLTGANNSVVGSFNGTGATYTPGDSIVAAVAGNTLKLADIGTGGNGNPTTVPATVTNVSNLVITSGEAITADTTTSPAGFSGLTQITASVATGSGTGGTSITAAGTTNITLNDQNLASSTDAVQGGQNIIVNASGVTGGSTINVGTVAQPAGTVTVTSNVSSSQTGLQGSAAINVTGGTVDTITANLSEAAGAGNTVIGSNITVVGGASTTAVTVTQSAAASAANAVPAVTGVSQTVSAVAPAPGVQGNAASTQRTATAAQAAVAGVVDGFVSITDQNYTTSSLAGTIATVTLVNDGGADIFDNVLATLNLTGGAGNTVDLISNATAPTNTTLALTLNGVGTKTNTAAIIDENGLYKTLNVTTATADSYVSLGGSNITTLNVAGTNTLNLASSGLPSAVTTIAISGAAGFNDGGNIAGDSALTSFTTTSSGKITASLSTTQTFVGLTGQDVITISGDATKAITGGSATNNELILNAANTAFNATAAHLTDTNVTGFTTLGFASGATGSTFDMSTFNSAFTALDVTANISLSVVKAATGTSLAIDNGAGTVSLSYVDTNGATDTTNLSLGGAALTGTTVSSLTLQDANAVGIGTVNVTSNGTDIGASGGATNFITTLVDNGLSVLNVSGTAGLTIGTLNEQTHTATSFTINSTETGQNGTTIGSLTDDNLGTVTFSGTAAGDIQDLNITGGTVTNLTIANTGTGTATVGDGTAFTDAILTTLNLNGNVNLTTGTLAATTGITVNGATDNSHVTIHLAGAAANATDTITLGNANDFITDGSNVGTVNVTVGTGYDLINVSSGTAASTFAANVTLGTHTDTATLWDQISVSATGLVANGANTTITGIAAGDVLVFTDSATTALNATTAEQTVITAAANLAGAIGDAFADTTAQHQAFQFQYGGATYVIEQAGAAGTALGVTDTVVKLVGLHTLSTTVAVADHIVFAS